MSLYRLNRLFNPRSGRALDVAVDHGFFGEPSFITGIEDMRAVVRTLVHANPDAIQLTLGQARHLQGLPGKDKPALVLRTDVANIYGNPLDSHIFSHHFPHAIEEAVRLDAVAVCVNLLHLPGHPEIREASILSIMALRQEATRYGMPLMIEPLVMQDNAVAGGGYMVDGDTQKVVTLVRQAAELGADLIKADPTDDDRGLPQGDRGRGGCPGPRAWRRPRRRSDPPRAHRSASSNRAHRESSTAATSSSMRNPQESPPPSCPSCTTTRPSMAPSLVSRRATRERRDGEHRHRRRRTHGPRDRCCYPTMACPDRPPESAPAHGRGGHQSRRPGMVRRRSTP